MLLMNAPAAPAWCPETFAGVLIRLRVDARLSQRGLARLAGVSHTAISMLEVGAAPPPHPTALRKLACGLATSPSGDVDEARAEQEYLVLMRAAGYLPPHGEPDLRRLIAQRVGRNVDLVDHLVRRLEGRGSVNQEAMLRVLDALLDTLPDR